MKGSLVPLILCLAAPSVALANGAYSHVHMSQIAADTMGPGELQTLLSVPENRAALEAGSMFPDSGYAIDDDYGELAHWEPFLVAFVAHLRATHGGDYSSPAAQRQIAFLLGVASHGMADQSYDTTLLDRAFEVDGPEDSEHPVDQFADYFIVIDDGVVFVVEPWAPYAELVTAIGNAGHTVSEAILLSGVNRMAGVLNGVQGNVRIAGSLYWDSWDSYPFLGTHVYNPEAVGSLPWVASLVIEYWAVIWDRLHARDDVDTQLVIRTVPEDGGVNWPVDLSDSTAWGRPAIWFGYGIDRDQITPLITMREAVGGASVPVTFQTAYGGRNRNLVFVRPDASLVYDTEYTVEVAAGATTLDDRTTTVPATFSFRTRCAPERLTDCPPLPAPLVTGPIPMRTGPPDAGPRADAGVDAGVDEEAGGCSVEPRARNGCALLGAWLFLGLLRARRR